MGAHLEQDTILELKQITKKYPTVLANDNIDVRIKRGEIHTFLGENGAGKSTLMKIIYGLEQPDSGILVMNGKEVHFKNVKDAINSGIGMVHQHFKLADSFTVAENILLGDVSYKEMIKSPKKFYRNIKKMGEETSKLAKRFGFEINPYAKIWQISVGERQRTEILKAIHRGIDILILDEPTSVLAPQEVKEFSKILRRMNKQGLTIIFITHILDEALELSDRITILRDGRKITTMSAKDATKQQLAKLMVGREIEFNLNRAPKPLGATTLTVQEISAISSRKLPALRNVSFDVHVGEIYSIAGIAGNGQKELAEVLTGNRKSTAGRININNVDCTNKKPRFFYDQGIAYIPEDRMEVGMVLDCNLLDNVLLTCLFDECYSKGPFIDWEVVEQFVLSLIKEYSIKVQSSSGAARALSGGNIQKFILARELTKNPKIVIAVHPTMGLDIASTKEIQKRLLDARNQDTAIVLISESLEEIFAISDTIAVMYKGEIVKSFSREQATIEEIGLLMTGGTTK